MKEYKNYKIILVLIFVACAHDLVLIRIFKNYGINFFENTKDYGIITNLISGLVIAPILETIIFQLFPHKVLTNIKVIKRSKYFICIYVGLSTLLFCSSHYYSWAYILAMIFPGILLSYYFHYFYKKFNNYNMAIYFITLFHFSKNFIALFDKYLLHNIL